MLTDLVAFVKADSTVNGLISGRIYPGVLDQASALPALTFCILDAEREHYLSGAFDGFNHPELEIECWGATEIDAYNLGQAVIALFDGFSGNMGNTAVSGILVTNESDRTREMYGARRQYCHVLDITLIYT